MVDPNLALSSQANASITGGKEGAISIERCSGGRDQEKACVAMFLASPPGVIKFDSIEPGCAVVRLWASPDLSPTLHVAGAYANQPIERLGKRQDTIVETVTFSGSMEAALSKGHSASGVKVLASTPFIGATPSYHDGAFRVTEPSWGCLVVEYTAYYTAYRVYYGLPDWAIQKIFREGKNQADFTLPPVLVMAMDGGKSSTAQIERRIASSIPPDCKDDDWLTDEGESTWVEYKVFPDSEMNPSTGTPKTNANYLTVRDYLKEVQYCRHRVSRKKVVTRSVPSGKNIEIIRTGKGL
ncbi:MAG: hypothetical protein OEV92_00340 [Nitrospinota bacterium]|nr:hypothetical protein [Nitrospinota bacterium]